MLVNKERAIEINKRFKELHKEVADTCNSNQKLLDAFMVNLDRNDVEKHGLETVKANLNKVWGDEYVVCKCKLCTEETALVYEMYGV